VSISAWSPDPRSKYMLPQLLRCCRSPRRLRFAVLPLFLTLGLCGCQTSGAPDVTGSLGDKAEPNRVADGRRDLELHRDRFRANPKDADAALQYGQALRAAGQRSQATRRFSLVMGERWRTMAISRKHSTSSPAPTPPTIPIGASSRSRERCSISLAETTRHDNTMRVP
jgi:hypothetical protein